MKIQLEESLSFLVRVLSSVASDHVSDSLYNGQILESSALNDDSSECLVVCSILDVHAWIYHFQVANVLIFIAFVWESSVNDDAVELYPIIVFYFHLGKLLVGVLRAK